MREQVILFLDAIGIPVEEEDSLLPFVLRSVEESILQETKTAEVPEALRSAAVYMAAGQYLSVMKDSGSLPGVLDMDAAVKQIQEGDTTVVYALGDGCLTPEARLERLIAHLSSFRGEIAMHRRMDWS